MTVQFYDSISLHQISFSVISDATSRGDDPQGLLLNDDTPYLRHAMNALIVYDSQYGNTEKIARAIGDAIPGARVLHASEADTSELESVGLLIVGSPTHGGRPMGAVQTFLSKAPASAIEGINVAAFDTRFSSRFAKVFGYAAGRIANALKRKGGGLVVEPEGFFVEATKGPLKEGELERAARWAGEVLGSVP